MIRWLSLKYFVEDTISFRGNRLNEKKSLSIFKGQRTVILDEKGRG